jgi:hypothetical protein
MQEIRRDFLTKMGLKFRGLNAQILNICIASRMNFKQSLQKIT